MWEQLESDRDVKSSNNNGSLDAQLPRLENVGTSDAQLLILETLAELLIGVGSYDISTSQTNLTY